MRQVMQHAHDQPVTVSTRLPQERDVPRVEQVSHHVDIHPCTVGSDLAIVLHGGTPGSRLTGVLALFYRTARMLVAVPPPSRPTAAAGGQR